MNSKFFLNCRSVYFEADTLYVNGQEFKINQMQNLLSFDDRAAPSIAHRNEKISLKILLRQTITSFFVVFHLLFLNS